MKRFIQTMVVAVFVIASMLCMSSESVAASGGCHRIQSGHHSVGHTSSLYSYRSGHSYVRYRSNSPLVYRKYIPTPYYNRYVPSHTRSYSYSYRRIPSHTYSPHYSYRKAPYRPVTPHRSPVLTPHGSHGVKSTLTPYRGQSVGHRGYFSRSYR